MSRTRMRHEQPKRGGAFCEKGAEMSKAVSRFCLWKVAYLLHLLLGINKDKKSGQ